VILNTFTADAFAAAWLIGTVAGLFILFNVTFSHIFSIRGDISLNNSG